MRVPVAERRGTGHRRAIRNGEVVPGPGGRRARHPPPRPARRRVHAGYGPGRPARLRSIRTAPSWSTSWRSSSPARRPTVTGSAFAEALARRAVRAPIVLTLRADFVAAVSALPPLAGLVQDGLYLLGPMTERAAPGGHHRSRPPEPACGSNPDSSTWSSATSKARPGPCRCCPTRWPRPGCTGMIGC